MFEGFCLRKRDKIRNQFVSDTDQSMNIHKQNNFVWKLKIQSVFNGFCSNFVWGRNLAINKYKQNYFVWKFQILVVFLESCLNKIHKAIVNSVMPVHLILYHRIIQKITLFLLTIIAICLPIAVSDRDANRVSLAVPIRDGYCYARNIILIHNKNNTWY